MQAGLNRTFGYVGAWEVTALHAVQATSHGSSGRKPLPSPGKIIYMLESYILLDAMANPCSPDI